MKFDRLFPLLLVLCGVTLLSLRLYFFWLETPPRATDSYYYALQIRELASNQDFIRSPLLSLLGSLSAFLPPFSPIDGYRAYVGLSLLSFVIGTLSLASREAIRSSVNSCALLVISASSLFLFDAHVAYPRQGLAIGLWCTGLALILRDRSPGGFTLLVLASTTHIFGAIMSLLTLILLKVHSRFRFSLLVALSITAIFWHLAGHEKFLFDRSLNFGWAHLCGVRGCSLPEIAEIALWGLSALILSIITISKRRGPILLIGGILAFYLALNLLPWSREGGTDLRLAWSAPWIAATLCAVSIRYQGSSKLLSLIWSSGAVIILMTSLSNPPRAGIPNDLIAILHYKKNLQSWIPQTALIRAPRGIDYLLAYTLERETTWRLTSSTIPKEEEVFEMRSVSTKYPSNCIKVNELTPSISHTVSCVQVADLWKISKRNRKGP